MITKEQREADRAICEAATPAPWLVTGADADTPTIKHLQKGAGYLTIAKVQSFDRAAENAAAIANAVNRLPAYIADAEKMERRIGALLEAARRHEAREVRIDSEGVLPPEVSKALDGTAAAVLRLAVRILRGEL